MRRVGNGIAYRIEGSGPTLLLLHGLMASGAMYDPLIPLLRDAFTLVVPDLRGHGASTDLPLAKRRRCATGLQVASWRR